MNWDEIKQGYPVQTPLMNLNNAAVSPTPISVQAKVEEYLRMVSRNPDFNMWSKLDQQLPETKRKLSLLADCSEKEIALNRNASEGLATVIFGLKLKAGDEVLLSPWDYPSALNAWKQRRERDAICVKEVSFDLLDDDEVILSAYKEAMTPQTKVMHLTHMIHWSGRILPVKRLCRLARERGILTVLDAAQSFAQIPLSFRDLDCDYLVTSLHKWLGAPIGNGMLVVREPLIDSTYPLLGTFDYPAVGIDKFDHWNLGTYHSAFQAAIGPAIDFHNSIGIDNIHGRLRFLSAYWIDRAKDIPGFTLHTSLENLAGVVLFSVAGHSSRAIEQELREKHQIHVKYREVGTLAGLRVSPHLYMNENDLDQFVGALRRVVEHS